VKTRGGAVNYINNYFIVSRNSKTTKAADNESPVLYAVNFQDESGYALLSADDRIPEEIIAVTEQGNVTPEDFEPVTGDLLPSANDDLSVEEYNDMVSTGVLALQNNEINQQCLAYVEQYISYDGYNVEDQENSSSNETFHWAEVKSVPRLVNTAWTQEGKDYLFNKYCPEVGLIRKKKAPVGCVCIAVAQIIAYHEYPYPLTCNGVEIDYNAIKQIYSYANINNYADSVSREMLARYAICVSGWCSTQYGCIFGESWGFAWPSNAKECFEVFGYNNVELRWGYHESIILQSLDAGCPVFMSAISGVISGHAWVIDGYIKRNYVADSNPNYVEKSQTLIHCNWGWHGDCNGYFTSGVFKTNEAVIPDPFLTAEQKCNFWCGFNTITYDNPNI
jgi:hypothetical protein